MKGSLVRSASSSEELREDTSSCRAGVESSRKVGTATISVLSSLLPQKMDALSEVFGCWFGLHMTIVL